MPVKKVLKVPQSNWKQLFFFIFHVLWKMLEELTFNESHLLFAISLTELTRGGQPLPRALMMCKARSLLPVPGHGHLLPKYQAASGSAEDERFRSGAFWF